MSSESVLRRTRGSISSNFTSISLLNSSGVSKPCFNLEDTTNAYSTSSNHFKPDVLVIGNDEDVQTDVLYPRFFISSNNDQTIDMNVFNMMITDYQQRVSTNSSNFTHTLSLQNRLYGSSEKHQMHLQKANRFMIFTTQVGVDTMSLPRLLTERGKLALNKMAKKKGWWLDVVSPTPEEMTAISKTFNVHPLTTEDIEAQEPCEKVEILPNYTFVCFRAFYIDPLANIIKPFNFYNLIFKDGLITFHFVPSEHCDFVRSRTDQLKEYMTITPGWLSYALIDSVTDSFAPIILQVEMEAVSIDELSIVLKKSEQSDMLKRISRCRKRSTQLTRLLNAKVDVIESLMKRYEGSSNEINLGEQKLFHDVLLFLGDILDHIGTMVQNTNHYDRILHRAHTNYLAKMNLELLQTYNMTNNVMNRLTFLTAVFIPLSLICGIWGMNVYVPGKGNTDPESFYLIIGCMIFYITGCTFFGKYIGLL